MKALAFHLFEPLLTSARWSGGPGSRRRSRRKSFAAWRSKQLKYTVLLGLMGRYLPFSEVTARALIAACDREAVEPKPEGRDALL